MFPYQRSRLIDDIAWNSFPEEPHKANSYVTLECWKYEGVDCAIKDSNIRVSSTYQSASGPNNSDQCVEERVKKWAGLDVSDIFRVQLSRLEKVVYGCLVKLVRMRTLSVK